MYLQNRNIIRDRFIPSRKFTNFDISGHLINSANKDEDDSQKVRELLQQSSGEMLVNTSRCLQQRNNYRRKLWSVMLNSEQNKVLNYSPVKARCNIECSTDVEQSWPVRARPKPLLQAPVTILDMPNLDTSICHHVIDWNCTGYLTTIYEGQVHMYDPDRFKSINLINIDTAQDCIKWNHDGTVLAVGVGKIDYDVLVWNFEVNKVFGMLKCPCKTEPHCSATALQWRDSSRYLIFGCTQGRLTIYDRADFRSYMVTKYNAHESGIISIQFSSKETHYVTSGLDKSVKLWDWNSHDCIISYQYSTPIKAVSWHPWKNSLLAMGTRSFLVLHDTNLEKRIKKAQPRVNFSVDCMSFNPRSAELVVSYYNKNTSTGYGVNYLTVLKNPTTIVDEIQYHASQVPYLLWDASGTKLATASGDENLCIWDFFGDSKETKKYFPITKQKKLTTNMMETVHMFSATIR